jgi:hypothetical protein
MDRRSDHDGGDVRRGRGHVCCVDADLAAIEPLARLNQTNCQNCAVWTGRAILPGLSCIYRADEQSRRSAMLWPRRKENTMTHSTNKPTPKLRKAPQPPLSHAGAIPDSDRAKRPPLSEPSATGQELTPGDRVEGLGNFGKPTGEFGTVKQANEDDAVVKWDDDGRVRVHQRRSRRSSPALARASISNGNCGHCVTSPSLKE